jgi:transposase
MTATTRKVQHTAAHGKLAFTTGLGQKPRERTIAARDRAALLRETKQRFDLSVQARVVSVYEAGREGLWLHRFLLAEGIDNRVVEGMGDSPNSATRLCWSIGIGGLAMTP